MIADPPSLRSAITYYEQAVALDSTFALAWAQLARAHARLLLQRHAEPDQRRRGQARRRAGHRPRARPARSRSWRSATYYSQVAGRQRQGARGLRRRASKIAPDNADLLTAAALAEQSLGRWDAAVKHLERAATLDPRSATTARRLAQSLLRLRRYPEAEAAADRGLAVAPDNLDLIENKAMIHLAQGDLAGARAAIDAAPAEVEPTALVTFIANYWDLYWVLDDAQQQLLLRLRPGGVRRRPRNLGDRAGPRPTTCAATGPWRASTPTRPGWASRRP